MFYILLSGFLCWQIFTMVDSNDMGKGIWHLNHVEKCEETKHKFKFDISKNKINRTHDGFNAYFVLDQPLDDSFGIRCDVCKMVDGGCKLYQVIADDSLVNFVNKFAKNNIKSCLELAGLDPPDFPLPEGEYEVENYVFDYSELPEDGPYGKFGATCFMIENTEEVGCIKSFLDFQEKSEADDDDDK